MLVNQGFLGRTGVRNDPLITMHKYDPVPVHQEHGHKDWVSQQSLQLCARGRKGHSLGRHSRDGCSHANEKTIIK